MVWESGLLGTSGGHSEGGRVRGGRLARESKAKRITWIAINPFWKMYGEGSRDVDLLGGFPTTQEPHLRKNVKINSLP